jgi:hypothetical protein
MRQRGFDRSRQDPELCAQSSTRCAYRAERDDAGDRVAKEGRIVVPDPSAARTVPMILYLRAISALGSGSRIASRRRRE